MLHKGSIVLETNRLFLRPVKVSDANEVYENWANDDEVSKFMRWNTHKNIQDSIDWLADCESKINDKEYYHWGIVIKDTNTLIGTIGAFVSQKEPERYELGYCIGRKYWRNGYTTEALLRVMRYLIDDVGMKNFICLHATDNPASGAVMRHAGFVYLKDGRYKSFDGLREFENKIYYLDV